MATKEGKQTTFFLQEVLNELQPGIEWGLISSGEAINTAAGRQPGMSVNLLVAGCGINNPLAHLSDVTHL